MTIRAVVFDIGGVLEVSEENRDPTFAFRAMVSDWESRLELRAGVLSELLERFREAGTLGSVTEKEWHGELRTGVGMDQPTLDAFLRDFWDLYLGKLNMELASYLFQCRPRYKTALLSNSFVGAREQEEARYDFGKLTDIIVYSHEVGLAKPDGCSSAA